MNRPGHYAVGLQNGSSVWHVGVDLHRDCNRCRPSIGVGYIDAFIEKELPGLLLGAMPTIKTDRQAREIAREIGALHRIVGQPDDETIARVMGRVGRLDKEEPNGL